MAHFDHPTHHNLKQTKAIDRGAVCKMFYVEKKRGFGSYSERSFFSPQSSTVLFPEKRGESFLKHSEETLAVLAVRANLKTRCKHLWTDKSAWSKSFNSCACEEPSSGDTLRHSQSLKCSFKLLITWILGAAISLFWKKESLERIFLVMLNFPVNLSSSEHTGPITHN